jgi:small-conductance mechanosensitive channel
MRKAQKIAAAVMVLLILGTLYGIWRTHEVEAPLELQGKAVKQPAAQKSVVDQSPLKIAQQLAQLALTPEEKSFAQEALRLADFEVDLTFDTALHDARLHPPPLGPEAKEIEQRMEKAQRLLRADQERAKALSEQVAKLPENKREAAELDLVQTEADLDLDQDEVDDAKQDFIAAGGDLAEKIQTMRKEHEDAAHSTASALPTVGPPPEQHGLVHRAQQWFGLHRKQMQLWQAKSRADTSANSISAKHNELDAKIDAAKSSLPELALHSKKSNADTVTRVSAADKSREDTATLLKKTQDIAEDQKTLAALDKRAETQRELAGVYAQWIDFVRGEQYRVLNKIFLGLLIIFAIALIGIFFSSWLDSLLGQTKMDRRQLQSLRTVTRVGLQIVALLLILLVIMGPPGQLGTFLGLAGAGLTVALKDFIVGFIGWFVLMGKNGIRLGDWVEINGVSGEVEQIGPFHTVLLETGNWTDSSHPTGRRVSFMNSFAIEGHYFNFSTTGQWLWDELQVVLPTGNNPYPVIDAIQKAVTEATQPYVEQAEQEWRSASSTRDMSKFSAAPAASLKPVVGGIEVEVRYITRASERYALRSKLNQAVVELLGGKPAAAPPAPVTH